MPLIERFAPDWLIISAGFDAHRNDPLAGLQLTPTSPTWRRGSRAFVPERRVLVVLEGGYDLEAPHVRRRRHAERVDRRVVPAGAGVDRRDRAAHRHRRPTTLGAVSLGGSGSAPLRCSDGHVRWGLYGAAGVVFVVRFSTGRVMLQKRSAIAHEGGTWSAPAARSTSVSTRSPASCARRRRRSVRSRTTLQCGARSCSSRPRTGRTRRSSSTCRASSGRRSFRDRRRQLGQPRRGRAPTAARRLRRRLAGAAQDHRVGGTIGVRHPSGCRHRALASSNAPVQTARCRTPRVRPSRRVRPPLLGTRGIRHLGQSTQCTSGVARDR